MADEKFELVSSYQPTGDQPQAIETLVELSLIHISPGAACAAGCSHCCIQLLFCASAAGRRSSGSCLVAA